MGRTGVAPVWLRIEEAVPPEPSVAHEGTSAAAGATSSIHSSVAQGRVMPSDRELFLRMDAWLLAFTEDQFNQWCNVWHTIALGHASLAFRRVYWATRTSYERSTCHRNGTDDNNSDTSCEIVQNDDITCGRNLRLVTLYRSAA